MTKKVLTLIFLTIITITAISQTPLTEAENFHVKTIYGEPIWLFDKLDIDNRIVVINFFSTSCGPCQEYAGDFQACYEKFGYNEGNTYFMGINWGNDNVGVYEFDSVFGLTYPTASGSQGAGNIVCQSYEILSYPTVIIITPDHNIVEQYIWPPDEDSITNAVISAGGIYVGTEEITTTDYNINIYPNPVNNTGKVSLNIDSSSELSFSIVNLMGQEVLSSNPTRFSKGNIEISFSVNELMNGLYFVNVFSDFEKIHTSRIAISH